MRTTFVVIAFLCFAASLFGQGSASCLDVTVDTFNSTCPEICDGRAELSVSGGTGNYYYFWSTGDSGDNMDQLDGLCPGIYNVAIVDLGEVDRRNPDFNNIGEFLNSLTREDFDCLVSEQSFTIGVENADCNSVLSKCPTTTSEACDCPLEVYVESSSASCPSAKDGQIELNIRGGSGYYNVTWSNQSQTSYQQVYGGTVYTARITDSDGRLMIVDVPVGIRSNDCTEGVVTVGVNSRTPFVLLSELARDNALLSDLIDALYEELANDVGVTVGVDPDLVGCDMQLSMILSASTKTINSGTADASYNIFMYNGKDNSFYNFIIDGQPKGDHPRDNAVDNGYHSVLAENGMCTVGFGFTFFPTCLSQVDGCETPLVVDVLTENSSCSEICNGNAQAVVSGGSGNYYYYWSTGDSGDNMDKLDALCSGEYSVIVVDLDRVENFVGFDPNNPTQFFNYLAGAFNSPNDCFFKSVQFTIDTDNSDCSQLPSNCPLLPSGGCECPLKVYVESLSASCPSTKDGQVGINVEGGSGFYNITWSNQSKSKYQQVYGGTTYTAIVEDSDGRRMVVDVPVGVRSVNCIEGETITAGINTPVVLLTDISRQNATLSDLTVSLTRIIYPILGLIEENYAANSDLVGCNLSSSLEYYSPTSATSVDGYYKMSLYEGNSNSFYNLTIDGDQKTQNSPSNTMVSNGYHSVLAENGACSVVFGFTFSPTCLAQVNNCNIEFTVNELDRPGCTGSLRPCNGSVLIDIDESNTVGPYLVEWEDENGVSQNQNSDDPQIIIENICVNHTYSFTVTSDAGCRGVNGILLNEEVAEEICCPVKQVSIDEDALYCSGDVIYVYASGGEQYFWTGAGIAASERQNQSVKIVVPNQSTVYSVKIINTKCRDVLEQEKEIIFTINVHDIPEIEIDPVSSTYCLLPNDELTLESNYINKPSYMQYNTRWDYVNFSLTGSGDYISPPTSNIATLYFDRINPSSSVDRSLTVYPVVNYANCEGQSIINCDLVCELKVPKLTYTLLKDSPDIVIPNEIDVCSYQSFSIFNIRPANVINLNSYIDDKDNKIDEICWRLSQSSSDPCLSNASSYLVTQNQTISVYIRTIDGCEINRDIAINYIELDELEYEIIGSNCKDGYITVQFPFGNDYQWTPKDGLSCSNCRRARIYLDQGVDNYRVDISSRSISCNGSINVDVAAFRETLNKSLDGLDYVSEKQDNLSCGYLFTANISDADRYIWNFGDGMTVETTNPSIEHTFFNPGAYTVLLTCQKDCAENAVEKPIAVEISTCSCN